MSIVDKIRDAGIVGAGGAGFPTHVKVNCKAEYVIANGAECEPLLRVDQLIMQHYADKVVAGMEAVMEATGASQGVICLKEHYHDAVDALIKAVQGKKGIRLQLFKSYYPAGDEQQMVYEVTGRVVPTGGLPLDVGAVVNNVSTLVNIADAMNGKPVTDKFVTVNGEVGKPITIQVPIGTPVEELIAEAQGPSNREDYTLIIGGPCMGKLTNDWSTPVTKTTGGVLVMKNSHPLICKKTPNIDNDIKLAKAVCCQCSLCTQMCPRNALGLNVQPHKAMRAAANANGDILGEINGLFSCCDCGLCTYYACNFGLSPSRMMQQMKAGLAQKGIRPKKEVHGAVDPDIALKKVPVSRLISRLGINQYDVMTPFIENGFTANKVHIPLSMHIGAPAVPVVSKGSHVDKGNLIADIKEKALGAKIHASITGTVTDVTEKYIEIQA